MATQIYVKYNPYRLETIIKINGLEVSPDSMLYKLTKGKRLQEWIGQFPKMLRKTLNIVDFSLEYCGMDLDWDDFEDAFEQAQKEGIVNVHAIRYIAGKSDDDINEKIVNVFQDLQEGPIDDFRDEKLLKAFENINNSIFSVNVIATMSSGKSTLINALIGKKLMPSMNQACTAKITEVLDTDESDFSAVVYDENNVVLQEVPKLTYDMMSELNRNDAVQCISVEGDIPFLDSRNMALMLVDTPGPNSAQNQTHKNITYRAINNDSNNLILYVLNGTQLKTNDDASLLHYVSEQIRKGGKQVRDRFLFVLNKMDQFNPEEEDIEATILSAKEYLEKYNIYDPQIFPCSAFAALNIRTCFSNIDIDNITWAQQRLLPQVVKDTLPMIEKFICYESMHLEKYSTLSPSAQQELNFRLSQAIEAGDTKEQALIHSGIYSIEAAIAAYVKKYAKTKKVKDLVESFQEVLESNGVLAKARDRVMTDAAAAKACAERAAAVREKISDGKEAESFKLKIDALNPMPEIEKKAKELAKNASIKVSRIFRPFGDTITNREEAVRMVTQFSIFASDAMAEFTSELESLINSNIVATGERLMMEYQEKILKFDDTSTDEQLDFQTVDLIKGALKTMCETAESWTTDAFATETVEKMGKTTYETKVYYEKVGQEEEEVIVGSHEEKVGTKRVKVGRERVIVGTRSAAKWYNPFSWFKTENVYDYIDKYEDQDVYKTVLDYETVTRDRYEERSKTIEKFSVSASSIHKDLFTKMRMNLADGTKDALDFATEQVDKMKKQFSRIFGELDQLIAAKYDELDACASDQSEKEANLEANQKLLEWIEKNMAEINSILDM